MGQGEVLLIENLRFHEAETKGDKDFSEALSKLGTVYVNDAFGTAHRAHASTTIVAQFFPNKKCFGHLLAGEITAIDKVMRSGEKPVLAILGGAKVSSKITIIENILSKVDHLIIGGGMAFTFIKAQGGEIGKSICEDDKMPLALSILEQAKAKGVQVHLPVDVRAGQAFSNDTPQQIFSIDEIPDSWEGMDAGPLSEAKFDAVVKQSKTILWNGPLGVFEFDVAIVSYGGPGYFKHQCHHRSLWKPVCRPVVDSANGSAGVVPHIHHEYIPLILWKQPAITTFWCITSGNAHRQSSRHSRSARGHERGPRGGGGLTVNE